MGCRFLRREIAHSLWFAVLATLATASTSSAACPPGWYLASTTGPTARAYAAMAYDPGQQRVLLWGGWSGSTYRSDLWSWDGTAWTSIPSSGPPAFLGTAAYDVDRSRFVLVVHGQTWEWDGASWSLVSTSGPSLRDGQAMTYDEVRHRTVLFGGYDPNANAYMSDTWEWDGVTWQQRLAAGPPARTNAMLAYHSGLQRVVLFGGSFGASYDERLWSWDGTSWSVLTPNGPPGRQVFQFAYDPTRGRLVVAGGEKLANLRTDQWEWDGVDWGIVANPVPVNTSGSACFDAARGELVRFGGHDATETLLRQTWTWKGSDLFAHAGPGTVTAPLGQTATLTQVASGTAPVTFQWRHNGVPLTDDGHFSGTATSQLSIASLAQADTGSYTAVVGSPCGTVLGPSIRICSDPAFVKQPIGLFGPVGVNLAFSVQAGGCAVSGYQWLRDGVALVNDARTSGATSANLAIANTVEGDAGAYQCLVTNPVGSTLSTLVAAELSNCVPTWTQRAATGPPGRIYSQMVYDSHRHRTVLFGGQNPALGGAGFLSDTWEWDGVQWQLVSTTGPSARLGLAMAYDAVRHRVVLFGGSNESILGDTWEWDGAAWIQRSTTGPPARSLARMVFDGTRCLLFGGSNASGTAIGDTWAWDGTSWQQLASNGPARATHGMAYDPVRGQVIAFGGWSGNNRLGDTWAWNGTSWSRVALDGPSAREGCNAAFDEMRQRIVFFGGYAGAAFLAETWEWDGAAWHKSIVPGGPAGRYDACIAYDHDAGVLVLFGGVLQNNTYPSQTYSRAGTGMAIATGPSDLDTPPGGSAVFTVAATGSGSLSYQWRKDGTSLADGGRVSGSSTATLTISAVEALDSGTYGVVVTGDCGTATASARLDVPCAPNRAITQQPADATVPFGSPAQFEVTAVGCAPVFFQWRKNGVALVGATSPTLAIPAVGVDDAGVYACLVSDAVGSTLSALASLNLLEPVLLSRTERIVTSTTAQVQWETRSDCTAIVQYGATPALGASVAVTTPAKTGSVILGRGQAPTLYYRLVLTDLAARTLTTEVREIVFPPSGARLTGKLVASTAFVPWNGPNQGIAIAATFQNIGTGNSGPVILDSATLNGVPARYTNGQTMAPRQLTSNLAPGATLTVTPGLVFSRAEVNLPPGSLATATVTVHWTDGLTQRSLQVSLRVRIPR